MKQYIKTTTSCWKCDFFGVLNDGKMLFGCIRLQKYIEHTEIIQEWCSLDDYTGEEE